MNILFITRPLNGLLMIGLPIALGFYLTRRFKLGWTLFWIGGLTFVFSQVGHIPFNQLLTILFQDKILPLPPQNWRLVFNAIVLGLSAGLWEELSRYAMYRWWAKDARSWRKGILLGAGHGGMEAMLLGALVLYGLIQMIALKNSNLVGVVPADQIPLGLQQIQAYWSAQWGITLLGAVERALTIPFHIGCSVMVLQAFTRKQVRWVWLAVGWHAFTDAAIAGYASSKLAGFSWGPYAIEGLVALATLVSLVILFALRQPEPPEPEEEALPSLPPLQPVKISQVEETDENLEKTRYN